MVSNPRRFNRQWNGNGVQQRGRSHNVVYGPKGSVHNRAGNQPPLWALSVPWVRRASASVTLVAVCNV